MSIFVTQDSDFWRRRYEAVEARCRMLRAKLLEVPAPIVVVASEYREGASDLVHALNEQVRGLRAMCHTQQAQMVTRDTALESDVLRSPLDWERYEKAQMLAEFSVHEIWIAARHIRSAQLKEQHAR